MPSIQWLAGFFDAEGSVSFNYKPNLDIVNTSPRTMFQVKDIMNKLGIQLELHYREKPSKSSKKPRWDLALRHDHQIVPFLKEIGPYVHGKKFQLNLIWDWYQKPFDGIKEKIMFANQVHNKIITKPEKVMQKLGITTLYKYDDIPVLTDEDSIIVPSENFGDLDYLAGLLDGEGTFNLHCRPQKNKPNRYTPQVLFNNTDKETVKRYCSVLKTNNLPYYITFRTAGTTSNRRRWDVIISGLQRTQKTCEIIKDRLETKRDQCDLLLQYCRFRTLNPKSINELGYESKTALEGMRKGIY